VSKVCYLIDPEEMLQAAQRGDVAKVRQLLASDTTLVNAKGVHNKTPLHLAAGNGHKAVVELLLGHGADFTLRDHSNLTPLDRALESKHTDIAELLRKKGVGS
jgi:ankyrin repeat protein